MKRGSGLLGAILWLTAVVVLGGLLSAADEPGDELVQMIVNLLNDKDRDMRAMGFQQVREAAKGPAATKRFAALLPKLSPEAQAGLLAALADRGDIAARPAVLEMLNNRDRQVRVAAIRTLGALGEVADVPLLVQELGLAGPEKVAAQASLARLQGPPVAQGIVDALKRARPDVRVQLLGILAARRALDSVPGILPLAEDANAKVRMAAISTLGQLAGPEHLGGVLRGVLKADDGTEREAAEKAVMFVCSRIDNPNRRAQSLLAAWAQFDREQQTILLPTLGRVGGAAIFRVVEAAIADGDRQRHDAGIRALCNWPDASVAPKLLDLARTPGDAAERTAALRALIRVAALPDKRADAEKLELLKKAMSMATRNEERKLVLKRARAIRRIDSLRFVAPYMNQPALAQEACATVVELAHHRKLREPNKAEFDQALDVVIRTSKNADVVDRAKRYKKGQT